MITQWARQTLQLWLMVTVNWTQPCCALCMCSVEVYWWGGECSLLGCLETKLHPSFWNLSAYEDQGWMEGKGGTLSVHHHHHHNVPTLHDRTGLQPPPPPPPLHLSPPLLLHPSFSLSVHLVCLTQSSRWKTQTCVRLCYPNLYSW